MVFGPLMHFVATFGGKHRPEEDTVSPRAAEEEVEDESVSTNETTEEEQFHFNVGGWLFSVPQGKLAQFPESLLWKESSALIQSEHSRLFIDRDGFTFRHVHYFLHTSKLSFSCSSELCLLYEQALFFQLTPLIQALDNLKDGKHHLRVRPAADIPVAERASLNYWKTRKCNSKPSEFTLKCPAFTGLHDKAPLGLIDTPLLETEEEVHYCFISGHLMEKYPMLINDDNLLWLAEDFALIEWGFSEFRFIVNYLNSGMILLPDNFSGMDVLEAEIESLQIPELTEAVKRQKNIVADSGARETSSLLHCGQCLETRNMATQEAALPLYIMTLGLLVKYPDSALGQLHLESTIDGNHLYITGNGALFKHVKNWLGTCKLPLTESIDELCGLCTYLDKKDITYEPMKDALRAFLKKRTNAPNETDDQWEAEIKVFSLNQIVKIYVGSHWYATYLKTLLKHSELLLNRKKVHWITCGLALLIHGDGQMFRHVLNFLRLGKLMLPKEFKEWPLLCQEVEEYQIPCLLDALYDCEAYRLWIKEKESQSETSSPSEEINIVTEIAEPEDSGPPNKHLQISPDMNGCQMSSNWSKIQDTPIEQECETQSNKCAKFAIQTKGAKRSISLKSEICHQATETIENSIFSRDMPSPPRKRAARPELTIKKAERKEILTTLTTPMQRLISLVKEWDMKNSRQSIFQPMTASTSGIKSKSNPTSSAGNEDALRRPATITSGMEHAARDTKPAALASTSSGNAKLEHFSKHWRPGPEKDLSTKPATLGDFYQMKKTSLLKNWWKAEQERTDRTIDETPKITIEEFGNAGIILKVEHTPVVGMDGSCVSMEDSVIYTIKSVDIQLSNPHAQGIPKDTAFLSFNMSHEEMFYARKCHFFLTDIILDSIRHRDPKSITAKVVYLVNKLWTLQISSKQFVEDLLSIKFFRNERHIYEKLNGWTELTLPFAWKYSQCIEMLIKKGYYKSISFSILEKYLQ